MKPDTAPGTIFVQPWWLDAVAPQAWDAVTLEENGRLVARMPYVVQRRYGFTALVKPPLTQTLGVWLAPDDSKYTTQLSRCHQRISALIEKLPPFDYFSQTFPYTFTNWLPFYWAGFQQTTHYTYVIDDLSDLDAVWQATRSNIRTDVRKAQKQLALRTDLGLDAFLPLNEKTFARQGLPVPYSAALVQRIDAACGQRQQRQMFFAEDAQGRLHAAAYLVWDEESAYYLLSGSDPDLRHSGAVSMVMWEAIRFAASVTRRFDFEGSMIQPIERFFRAFGARQTPYMHISKINALSMKVALDMRSWYQHWQHLRRTAQPSIDPNDAERATS